MTFAGARSRGRTIVARMDNLRPGALLTLARSHSAQKVFRYGMVSAVGVVVAQVLLTILYKFLGMNPTFANIVAVSISALPCYVLSKQWVWGKSGKSHLLKEVVPFWAFAFFGLLLSTLLVHFVKQHTDSLVWINGASLSGFGVLWVARFFVLDRLIWRTHHHTPLDEEIEEEEAARAAVVAMAEADLEEDDGFASVDVGHRVDGAED